MARGSKQNTAKLGAYKCKALQARSNNCVLRPRQLLDKTRKILIKPKSYTISKTVNIIQECLWLGSSYFVREDH